MASSATSQATHLGAFGNCQSSSFGFRIWNRISQLRYGTQSKAQTAQVRRRERPLDQPAVKFERAGCNLCLQNQGSISPASGARFLELAAVALGLKKPSVEKKAAAASIHQSESKA